MSTDGNSRSTAVNRAYRHAGIIKRSLVAARPTICPPEPIVDSVPQGASVLDVGCGVGAMLLTLSVADRISAGTGCDISAAAIATATQAAAAVGTSKLSFVQTKSADDLPCGPFDAVMLIDVMHHISPSQQRGFFQACAERIHQGGRLIYKDMAEKPLWKNLFNRLHDAVVAREMIHYAPLATVKSWAEELDLTIVSEDAYSRFAYAHELLVFEKAHAR